jgi:hypothetical protein
VLLAAQNLATSLGMLLVQLQGMQQQEHHAMHSMQLLLWQMLVRGQAATVQQHIKDLRWVWPSGEGTVTLCTAAPEPAVCK